MDMSFIDSIDWGSMQHAYGEASNAPAEIANLLSKDEDKRDDAVYGFLYSSAYHQGTIYSCTPSVMRCVIHIIRNEGITSLETIGKPLIQELLGFLNACAFTWRFEPDIASAAFEGRDLYREYIDHPDRKTSAHAQELLKICEQYENNQKVR
ncbi:hypothetical protein [uncultured Pseudoteredinibacter sp.]|uniref:hypothetical protein n=1 Tax=uncultured Pseudoteredinibacter sp. TaxID=1641701 RepID=UPI002610D6E7|nr:hypothetical protein [uncultured Pseudoteredinibacter sp.]